MSIRGRILSGVVKSLKMKRTCVIRRDYLHYIKKYNRFEKRHRNISAHISPAFIDAEVGDQAIIGQCRPLSKVCVFVCYLTGRGSGVACSRRFRIWVSAALPRRSLSLRWAHHAAPCVPLDGPLQRPQAGQGWRLGLAQEVREVLK